MTESYRIFVGIDWASQQHQVWVADAAGTRVGERTVNHMGRAIAELVDWVVSLADGETSAVAVGLETPRGPLVDMFLERGCHVFAINPKQLDRFRDRFSVAGAKDDARDAEVLSSALRTDRHAFRQVRIDDPLTIQLREFSRQDTELGEDLGRLANRLRDHLLRTWPELLRLAPAADEPWLWALLQLASTPLEARRLGLAQLRRLLRAHRIRRVTAEELRTVLRSSSVYVAPGVREGVRVRIVDLVDQLFLIERQRRAAERRLAATLRALTESAESEHGREQTDVTILQSLPGIGTRIAATLLAEAADALRHRDYHAIRQLGGIAPVTKRSGKSRVVTMRYACDHRLQTAFYHWARCSIQRDDRCRAHYVQLRRAGHSHPRALRGVIDRMLVVLVALLNNHTLYDATRRGRRALEETA
jgi:transposase